MKSDAATVLRVFLIVYMLYAYAKFIELFARPKESKKRWLRRVYANRARTVRIFDNVMLVVMAGIVGLVLIAGPNYLNFTAGLLVGMTLIQIYFHRFADPVASEWMPDEPVTPLKLMAYSIQATPEKAWRELIFMTLVFAGALYMLVTNR